MRLSPLDPWAFAAFDATDQQGVHHHTKIIGPAPTAPDTHFSPFAV
jgi:hypothetical protein